MSTTAEAPGLGATMLEQSLWRDLLAASDERSFGEAWLGLTCRSIPGAIAGVLVLAGDGPPRAAAAWPAGVPAQAGLVEAALAAGEARRGVVQPVAGPGTPPTRLAYPLLLDGRLAGAAAVEVAAGPGRDPRQAMRQLQWAMAWVRDHRRAADTAAQRGASERTGLALDLLAAALEEERFTAACRIAVTELAVRLGCERVAFGVLRRQRVHVVSVSHTAQFGAQMRLVRQLGDAMDEAVDQRAVVLFPPPDGEAVATRAHAILAGADQTGHVLTVPLLLKDRFVGAMTFERAADRPFDQAAIDLAEAVAAILAPALMDKREIDRWLPQKAWDAARRQLVALLGPGHLGRKLALAAAVAVALAAQFARGEYRIAADGRVQGAVQRALVAPFDGFVAEAPLKAGDVAREGQVLAALDERDLRLEQLRWRTERQQHADEYDQALGARKRADAVRAQNLLAQADAQLRLTEEQLARARVTAPFDGLVISGDLSQTIGAPVRRGDTLFELAPLRDYRVELSVPEDQVADVQPGQRGTMVAAALPEQPFGFTVERVTPVATARDGRLVFRVDARLDNVSDRLRPGMEGVGKIEAGERRVAWIWLRSLIHWAQLATWRWLP